MKIRTRATLDGLALELSTRIYDVTTPRPLTPTEYLKRFYALEHAIKLTLEVMAEARLECMPLQEDTHVKATQH